MSSFSKAVYFKAVFFIPLALLYLFTSAREVVDADVARWMKVTKKGSGSGLWKLLALLGEFKEFRSLYYRRVRTNALNAALIYLLKRIYWEQVALIIATPKIGPGLFIQHGFSTVITAAEIGENCWINQQVTIGYKETECPVIGNNVLIAAGAKVLGGISLGDNVVVGANAVVVKDVPPDCVVAGVPARVIRENGVKTNRDL